MIISIFMYCFSEFILSLAQIKALKKDINGLKIDTQIQELKDELNGLKYKMDILLSSGI